MSSPDIATKKAFLRYYSIICVSSLHATPHDGNTVNKQRSHHHQLRKEIPPAKQRTHHTRGQSATTHDPAISNKP